MRRTGIDLSSTRCILADAEAPAAERRTGERRGFRVHRYASLSSVESSQALTAELKALLERKEFPRRAWINLWDVRSSHQYLLLPSAAADELESKARRHAASILGMNDGDLTVGTVIGSTRAEAGQHPKTEVSFFAAGTHEIRQRLRPFIEAGFTIEGVTTPCGALWSQAKLRKLTLPGEVHAHVALGPAQSALGIFSNGALLYARDINWGYGAHATGATASHRQDLARRLSTELRHSFLYLKQYWEDDVSQVLLSGDMPEIRSLTAPMIELLNIEVETLDTLEGIDASRLPEGFAWQAATFRLATSIAADPPPINLLPSEAKSKGTPQPPWWILAGGAAAAIALAAFLYGRSNVASQVAAPSRPLQSQPPEVVREAPIVTEPPTAYRVEAPTTQPRSRPPQVVPRKPAAAPGPPEVTEPDPVVRSILVSGDRRLALMNGRIVSVGDPIGTAVVRAIEPGAVVIATVDGKIRRIELARPANRVARR